MWTHCYWEQRSTKLITGWFCSSAQASAEFVCISIVLIHKKKSDLVLIHTKMSFSLLSFIRHCRKCCGWGTRRKLSFCDYEYSFIPPPLYFQVWQSVTVWKDQEELRVQETIKWLRQLKKKLFLPASSSGLTSLSGLKLAGAAAEVTWLE